MRRKLRVRQHIIDRDAPVFLQRPSARRTVIGGDALEMRQERRLEPALRDNFERPGFPVVELDVAETRSLQLDRGIEYLVQ